MKLHVVLNFRKAYCESYGYNLLNLFCFSCLSSITFVQNVTIQNGSLQYTKL